MALLRTTWTDDDGSGTTGTVLNAAALAAIYDKLGLSMGSIVGGRLTLTSGTAVTTADVTAATNVFYTPHVSAAIALYDGVSAWNVLSFAETTLALGTLTASLPYDVFGYNNSGTLALEALAWSTTTARATALVKQDGVWVKTGATTRRYLGTFYTTSTTTTEDSATKRYLYNANNRAKRVLLRQESTSTWPYTVATWRQANAAAANQVEVVIGLAESPLELRVSTSFANTTANVLVDVGIGEDSTSSPLDTGVGHINVSPAASASTITGTSAYVARVPAVGRHFYAWLEISQATGVTTWQGNSGFTPKTHISGISGWIEN